MAGGKGQIEVVQDLISGLFVKRAHSYQYPRDPA